MDADDAEDPAAVSFAEELLSLPPDELEARVEAEKQIECQEVEKTTAEELRNSYVFWSKMSYWSPEEAASLLCAIPPNAGRRNTSRGRPFHQTLRRSELEELLRRAAETNRKQTQPRSCHGLTATTFLFLQN